MHNGQWKNFAENSNNNNQSSVANRDEEALEITDELEQQSDEANETELLLLNGTLAFEMLTPDNAKTVFGLFNMLMPLLAQTITPEEALRDPIAQTQAYSPEHQITDLYEERVYSHHIFLRAIRWIFSQARFPDFTSTQGIEDIQNNLSSYLYSLGDWPQLWTAFKEHLISQFPEGQFIIEYFEAMYKFFSREWLNLLTLEERQRHDELYELLFKNNESVEIEARHQLLEEFMAIEKKVESARRQSEEEMQQYSEKYEKQFMAMKEQEHGRSFKNFREQSLYASSLRLQKELPYLISLTSRQARELLARRAYTDTFCYSVLNAIKQLPSINNESTLVLTLFNKMLNDFVSVDPEGLWPFSGNFNFLHDIFYMPDGQTILDQSAPTKRCADIVVDQLESLFNDLQAVFNEQEELTDEQEYLQLSLRWHCEERLVELFLSDVPYHYAYGNEQQQLAFKFSFKGYGYSQNTPLVEEIKDRYQKLQDLRNWRESERDSYKEMLEDIHIFPFTVLRKIYRGNNIARQIYRHAIKNYNTKQSYSELLPTIQAAIHTHIESLLQELKSLVKGLIEQRKANGEFSEVLGVGFNGPLFEQNNFANNKKNIIYLAFSRTGCTEWHYYLLALLRSRMYQIDFVHKNIEIKIIGKQGNVFTYQKEENVNDLIDARSDHVVYTYILNKIIQNTLSATSDIHPDLKEIWLKIIIDIIADAKSKDLNDSERNRLISCIKAANISLGDYKKN